MQSSTGEVVFEVVGLEEVYETLDALPRALMGKAAAAKRAKIDTIFMLNLELVFYLSISGDGLCSGQMKFLLLSLLLSDMGVGDYMPLYLRRRLDDEMEATNSV